MMQIFLQIRYNFADVAQLAEQLICNQQVIGSSPIIGFMDGFPSGQSYSRYFAQIAQLVEQRTENPRVTGSIPVLGT